MESYLLTIAISAIGALVATLSMLIMRWANRIDTTLKELKAEINALAIRERIEDHEVRIRVLENRADDLK